MLPSSHAWRMLCRLYGLLLKQEWARRLAEIGALPVFMASAERVNETWSKVLAQAGVIDERLRCGCGYKLAANAGQLDMLEPRVLLSGDTLATATPLLFTDVAQAPGYAFSRVNDAIDLATDIDYWSIDVLAGDRLSLQVQSQGTLNAYLELRNAADGVLRSDDNSSAGNDPLIVDYTVPTTGRLYARVSGTGLGDYGLRVDRGRGVDLESDASYANNAIAGANPLTLRAEGVLLTSEVAGVVMADEGTTTDQDTYLIGYLKAGSNVALTLAYPAGSTLDGKVQLLSESGSLVAEGNGALAAPTAVDGRYYARVLANAGKGIDGAYVLKLSVGDSSAPTVTAVNGLPAVNTVSDKTLYRFDVVVDKELAANTVQASAFEMRNAGPNDVFGDEDDVLFNVALHRPYARGNTIELVVLDGPLPEGKYQFRISSAVTDVTGSPIDGNGDGNGGDAYLHVFTLDLSADDGESAFVGAGGATLVTAVPLPVTQDATVPQMLFGRAIGVVYPAVEADTWKDSDWWQIELQAGDRVSLRVDMIEGSLNPVVRLVRSDGQELASNDNGGAGEGAFLSAYSVSTTGTYYVNVGKSYWSTISGMYRLRVDVARGVQMEGDSDYSNDGMGSATALTLTQSGSLRNGAAAGLIMQADGANVDEDYYTLGQLTAGNAVRLWLDIPAKSTLVGQVRLRDSLGRILSDEDGTSGDGEFTATLTSDGVYYAEVLATSGAGTNGYYLVHAQVGDTIGPRVVSIARVPEQLPGQGEYQSQVQSTNPLLYYKLNESSGTSVLDSSATGLTGTYQGAVRLGESGVFGEGGDGAVHFDAAGHISVNDPRLDLRREMSFSFWLNVNSFTNTWTPLITKSNGSEATRTYALWLRNDGMLRLDSADGTREYLESSGAVIGLNSWKHVAGIVDRNAGEMRVYVDGRLVISGAVRKTDASTTSSPLMIGWSSESSSSYGKLNGRMDDLAIYGRVVTEGALLKPFWTSKGQGSEQATDQLLSTWSMSFSEKLASATAVNAANYELVGAGVDGVLDTADDVAWNLTPAFDADKTVSFTVVNGPLVPGRYRFRVLPGVTDALGNALDGNGDGTGGDAYEQTFTIGAMPGGVVYEGQNNNTRATATPLALTGATGTSEWLFTAQPGFGSIDPALGGGYANEADFWSIDVQAGDRISVRTVLPAGSGLDAWVGLWTETGGSEVRGDDNGGPNSDAYISNELATYTGKYYVQVGKSYWAATPGNYLVYVDVVRGAQAESDGAYANNAVGGANALSLTTVGKERTATVAGLLMGSEGSTVDVDTYRLGAMTPGDLIEASVRTPGESTAACQVQILDSLGNVLVDGDASEARAALTVRTGDTYYVRVVALSGAGSKGHYVLDVKLTDATAPQITKVTRLPEQLADQSTYQQELLASNPLVYYKLNESSGTSVTDSSGNGITGSYTGAMALGVEGAFGAGGDGSASFNNSGQVTVTSELVNLRREVSFSMWLWLDSYGSGSTALVYKGNGGYWSRAYALWMNTSGGLSLNTTDGSSVNSIDTGNSTVQLKRWQHVAGVIDRNIGSMRLYVDGLLVGISGVTRTDAVATTNALTIGGGENANRLNGRIDEFALYDEALNEQALLAPHKQSRGRGVEGSTNDLVATWSLTSNEVLGSMAGSQDSALVEYNGHKYIWLSSRTPTSAIAWAQQNGGHLVTVNDAAEQSWLVSQFSGSGNFWINATDAATEGSWTTTEGAVLPYTHWASGQPDNGSNNEDYAELQTNGWWNDLSATTGRGAVIEFEGGDADSDGLPDGYDALPNDPYNGYELRSSGSDGAFNTADDVLWQLRASFDADKTVSFTVVNGPLVPGRYRFRVLPGVTDALGNALDGNGDGTGGDAYEQTFTIGAMPGGVVYEGQNNNTRATATPLALTGATGTSEWLFTAQPGFGSIDPALGGGYANEADFWSIDVQAGDRISVRTVLPAGSGLDAWVGLWTETGGSEVRGDDNGGPNSDAYISNELATYTGKYYVQVGKSYWAATPGNYLVYVDVVRGAQAESDGAYANNAVGGANALSLTTVGKERTATVAGLLMGSEGSTVDVDTYRLGAMTPGDLIEASVRTPGESTAACQVQILDSLGNVLVDGDASEARAALTVRTGDTYYVRVVALSGAGSKGHYVLDVKLTDATAPQITKVTRLPEQLADQSTYQQELLASNPLVYYKLNESSGTSVTDSSGNGITGSYTGAMALGVEGAFGAGGDGSASFNNSGQVTVTSELVNLRREVSFSMWLWLDSYGSGSTALVYKGNGGYWSRAYALWMNTSGGLSLNTTDGSSVNSIDTGNSTVQLKRWQHVAGVIDRNIGSMRLYVDGLLVGISGVTRTDAVATTNALTIGGGENANRLNGRIDEFALYDEAIVEDRLLGGYRKARGKGAVAPMTETLFGSWQIGVSEQLLEKSADTQLLDLATFNGHTYVKISSRTWSSAAAWAEANGGRLVTLNDSDEQSFVYSRFGSTDLWINLTDEVAEGSWRLQDGTAPGYTNWSTNEPDSGDAYDFAYIYASNGKWYDGHSTWGKTAVIEFVGDADVDGDQIPDVVDARPTDASNGWEVRSAGADGLFDSADDVLYSVIADYDNASTVSLRVTDGPLAPGKYRFTITASVTDPYGNAIDGNRDGVGGDAYVQYFEIAPLPTAAEFEGKSNDTRETAKPVALVEDPANSGSLIGRVRGSIDPTNGGGYWNEVDWFSVTLQAGDKLSISQDSPDGALNPYVGLYGPTGTELVVDDEGGPGSGSFISGYAVTTAGTYYIAAGKAYWHDVPGNYDLRIEVARGINVETDREYDNNTLAKADPITYSVNGNQSTATVAGTLMAGQSGSADQDYFDLGTIAAGQTILLSTRIPGTSLLRPIVEIRDANNKVVSIATNPSDAVARADISTSGRYYALLLGAEGHGSYGQYLMDIAIQPTADLNFADLVVSAVDPVVSGESGGLITVGWTVGNFGAVVTPGAVWNDRVVLSSNNKYGDADDVQLYVGQHNGALAVNETYINSASVRLPVGISGTYYIIVATDSTGLVSEFIFESNNATPSEDPFTVALTPYADLELQSLTAPARIIGTEQYTVQWTVKNQGTGTTGNGRPAGTVPSWVDRIVVSTNAILGDADDQLLAEVAHAGELASGGSYAASFTGMLPAGMSLEGDYRLFVVTDAAGAIYEYTDLASNSDMTGQVEIVPRRYVDLDVTAISIDPTVGKSGDAISVTYTVANNGIGATSGGWTDRVYLSGDSVIGGDTLLASFDWTSAMAAGEQYARTVSVTLPERISGDYYIVIVTDSGAKQYEYKFESNNSEISGVLPVTRRDEADLATAITGTIPQATWGQAVSVTWTVSNVGAANTRASWIDRVYLSSDASLDGGDTALASLDSTALAKLTGSYTRTANFTMPVKTAGTWYIIVKADNADAELEPDELNNVSSFSFNMLSPDLVPQSVGAPSTSLKWGESFDVDWIVKNLGTGSALSNWSDRLYLSADTALDGADIALDTYAHAGPLASGAQYAGAGNVKTELNWKLPDGTYYLLLRADVNSNQSEGDENNNVVASGQITFAMPALPDLTVSGVTTAQTSPKSGESVTVQWTENNAGTAALSIGTSTRVRITRASDSTVLVDRVMYYDAASNAAMTAGGQVARQLLVNLPNGPGGAGEFSVQVTADYYNQAFEHNGAGNAESNNVGTGSFAAALAGYPDLVPDGISVVQTALQSGGQMTMNWSLTNSGNAPVSKSFSYRLQVLPAGSSTALFSKLYRYDTEASGPIAAGASKDFSASFKLPDGTLGSGDLVVRVTADYYNEVFEYREGVSAELNNQAEITVNSTLAAYPDLQVTDVQTVGTSFQPADTLQVSWVLKNTGATAVSGGVSEKIYLSTAQVGGSQTMLSMLSYTDTIGANSQVTRTALVKLPVFAAGQNWIVVQTDSASQVFELNEANNTSVSATAISIVKGLTMSLNKSSVDEGGSGATVTLSRNGPTTDALLVTISNTQPGSLTAPATVTIPAGSSSVMFLVSPVNDDQVDGSTLATLSASAAGFQAASAAITVADDDVPTISVQISPDPVSEGAGVNGVNVRVMRNTPPVGALTVYVVSNDENRISVPYTVVIPDGAQYVDVKGTVKDNIYIDGTPTIRITATANGYAMGADGVVFADNDVPDLTLSAEATTVSEAAGAYATVVTVTRSVSSPIDLYVHLSGAAGNLTVPAYVKIPAYQTSASFAIGALNNGDVSGDRLVFVVAKVVDSFTRSPVEAGKAQLGITITEDDGATLQLTALATSIREDATGTVRVRRNTGTTGDLWVDLASSNTQTATVPARVLIPDGADTATFTVTAVTDSAVNGTRNVTITASTIGYGGGSAVISITEGDLPDLAVTGITAPAIGETGETIALSYVVQNQGVAESTASWNDQVYISEYATIDSRATLLRTFIRSVPLAVGGSYSNSFQMSLPNNVGKIYIMVQTETLGAITELKEGNNSRTSAAIAVSPSYSATVSVSQGIFGAGQAVLLNGLATRTKTGDPAAYEFVKLHVRVNGTVRWITAFTAADGTYQAMFRPLANEAGNYEVGATHPGLDAFEIQATFAIAGMKADGVKLTVTPDVPVTKTITVTNRSSVAITGITTQLVGVPEGMGFTVDMPSTLPGNGSVTLTYTINASDPELGEGTIGIKLSSAQGASVDIPVTVNVVPLTASLLVNPVSLSEGMIRGERKTIDMAVRNIGSAPSGEISVLLPEVSWMRLVSPSTIDSLQPGAYATITLELCPASDLALQLYQGQIVVASAGGASRSVGFSFRAVSTATGDAHFAVTDDYTYYVEGQPKVANATVRLSDPITGELIVEATTGADGTVDLSNIPEGAYQLEVYAAKHGTFRSRFDIAPGVVNEKEVFIPRQLVTYNWTVVPVDIQDTYKVVLEPTFETNVPVPVVVVENPSIFPVVFEDQWSQFTIRMTNHGLIAAQGLTMSLPESDFYELEVLVSDIGVLPAKTTIEVPVRIRAKANALQYQRAIAQAEAALRSGDLAGAEAILRAQGCEIDSGIPCMPKLPIGASYHYVCDGNVYRKVTIDATPICAAKSVYDCLKQVSESAASAFSTSDLANAPCALIDAFLQCAADDISDCTKAIVKAACQGIMGAVTGGWVGAGKGLLSAASGLLSCLCGPLGKLDWGLDSGTSTGGDGGWGGWGLNTGAMPEFPFSSGTGGWFGAGECGPGGSSGLTIPTADGQGVCARVRLQIEQEAVLTRTGFAGTFELENGTTSTTLTDIRVDIDIRDALGNSANELFGYRDPDVAGLGNVSGTGVLAGGQSGTARWLFVPTRDAAPSLPTGYKIGGTLRYLEDGVEVVVPLLPATITVFPDPLLSLDYFLQKDVYSDDPFTDEVEASNPFALGVLVSNTGAGNARNFAITSGQPRIIENEKGLLIDFKIIGTQVGQNVMNPSLTASFGNIIAGETDSAVWLMTSTLQGQFVEYNASFTHVDDFGNPRTSLIDRVSFHELNHSLLVNATGYLDDNRFDFLANDIIDSEEMPDTLYLSTGEKFYVNPVIDGASSAQVSTSRLTVELTASATSGWSYTMVPDPGEGFVLKDVVRSDGKHLRVGDQAWRTDRIFGVDAKATWVSRLHILDLDSTGSYTLVYAKPDEIAPTVTLVGPVTPDPRTTAVDAVQVKLSEALADGSFEISDLLLKRDGTTITLTGVSISKIDGTTYQVDGLFGLTGLAGDYTLTVNVAGLSDRWDNVGMGTKSIAWTVVPDIPVVNSVGAGMRPVTNQQVSEITIVFSKAVDVASFDLADLVLTRDGNPVALSSPASIVQVSATEFRVEGLGQFTAMDGDYSLEVNAAGVTDLAGNDGAGTGSASWKVDTVAPTIVQLEQLATNPRNIAVLSLDVEFSKPIDMNTFTAADVVLSRDGGADLFTNGLTYVVLSDRKIRFSGFTHLTGVAGQYSITVLGAGITDAAGNAVASNASSTWTLDLTPPTAPINLAIVPDNGTSGADGKTNTLAFTLNGDIAAEAGMVIRVYDADTNTHLGSAQITGNRFSKALTFTSAGSHNLRVYSVDAAGNVSSNALYTVFIDLTHPQIVSVAGVGAANIAIAVNELTVTFTEAIDPATFTLADVTLTRAGTALDLSGASIVKVNDLTYRITGLSGLTDPLGQYALSLNQAGIADESGNTGLGTYDVAWNRISALASIGDRVWSDSDADGVQDEGEAGMAGIAVSLFDEAGILLGTTTSDATGAYLFDALDPAKRYYLEFAAPAGYGFSDANVTTDDADSDPSVANGRTTTFDVAVGANATWDAGLVQLGSIGGVVWNDLNGNGQRDAEETVLNGWTVFIDSNLDGAFGESESSDITAGDGSYSFADLRPGTYVLRLVLKAGWHQTTPGAEGEALQTTRLGVQSVGAGAAGTQSSAAMDLINVDDLMASPEYSHLTGSGYSVVVIDSGIDLSNPSFGPDADGNGVADRIIFSYDFANGTNGAMDTSGHGTHIAGIIGSSDATYRGLAPDVNIIVLKVLDGSTGSFSQAEQALKWVISHAAQYNIVAVNMSLGDGRNWDWPNSTDCGCGGTIRRNDYGLGDEFASLRSLNVIVSAAAGNNFYEFNGLQGLAYPAADPNTISVGAVWAGDFGSKTYLGTGAVDYSSAADRIAGFSQRQGGYLDVFAPGVLITSAALGGGVATMQGTSQSSAFVTGAAVIAQQLAMEHLGRFLTLDEFRTLLQTTGTVVFDGDDENDNVINTGQSFVRLDVFALANAISELQAGDPATPEDPEAPAGSAYANAYSVSLAPGTQLTDADFGVQTDALPPASNIRISPDTGLLNYDEITASNSVLLAGDLPGTGLSVSVYDLTTNTDLGSATVTGTTFEIALNLSAGSHQIRVRTTAANDLYSDAEVAIRVDQTSPAVQAFNATRAAGGSSSVTGFTLQFSENVNGARLITDGTVTSAVQLLQILADGQSSVVTLQASQFTYEPATNTLTWSAGATPLTAGHYRVMLNNALVTDVAGNAMSDLNAIELGTVQEFAADGLTIASNQYSAPAIADYNSDGVPDLLVGEQTAGGGKIKVYLNTGTASSPVYAAGFYLQSGGADLVFGSSGCLGAFPRMFDWNADGLQDLVVGRSDGTITLMLNAGTATAPLFAAGTSLQAGVIGAKTTIDVGDRATFDIADWNSDGWADLIVGALDGKVRVYLNRATTGTPDLDGAFVVRSGAGELVVPTGRSSPVVADLNGDGRKDLLLGNTEGQLYFYANLCCDATPTFAGGVLLSSDGAAIDLAAQARSRPEIADVTGDGVPDIILGGLDGKVRLFAGVDSAVRFSTEFLVVEMTAPAGINEGASGSFSVLPECSALSYSWDFGDGTSAASGPSVSHAFADSGSYTIRVTITGTGLSVTEERVVTVANVAPTARLATTKFVREGSTAVMTLSGQTDVTADKTAGLLYSYDFNNDGVFEISDTSLARVMVPASYMPDGPAWQTVKVRISDKDGGFTEYTSMIQVLNAPPTVYITAANTAILGAAFLGGGNFVDAGDDTWTATIDYGDGTPMNSLALGAGGTFVFDHAYSTPGTYSIMVRVTDSDGATGLARKYVVVPPNASADAIIDDGSAQRSRVASITYTFTTDISSIDADAWTLSTLGGAGVEVIASRVDARTYVLTFAGTNTEYGSVVDGRYVLTLHASSVHTTAGGQLSADASLTFHRLFGDANGDGIIGSFDLVAFRSALNTTVTDAAYRSYFDLDASGVIDAWDYDQLRSRGSKRV